MAGRSKGWVEDQTDSALGATRNPPQSTKGPTHKISLDLRSLLPRAWRWCGPGSSSLQYTGYVNGTLMKPHPKWHRGAHAILIVDRAGWHMTNMVVIPSIITIMPLPPRSPELNPVENIWQFMRDNWLSNRVFTSYEEIVTICWEAWNKLIDQPWKIISIGMRDWAHQVLINANWP